MKKLKLDCRLLDILGQAREESVGIFPFVHGWDLIQE